MAEHNIVFDFKARYYKLGEIHDETRSVWFVLHGYGQLAQYFIRKFSVLETKQICVIAPEGLSRFYLENFQAGKGRNSDRVGATWMTREDRLTDIRNYLQFLNTIYQTEIGDKNVSVTVLGFSQGSATASRWVLDNKIKFQRLILWAGMFPADMDLTSGKAILKEKDITMVYGNKDPFLTDERFLEMTSLANNLSTDIKQVVFEGGHDIDQETLLKLL